MSLDCNIEKNNKWKKEQTILSDSKISTMASTANINELYEMSVQNPLIEVTNLLMMHHHVHNNQNQRYIAPLILREDFCGTALLCKAWLERNVLHRALGIDWDSSVLDYSKNTHFSNSCDNIRLYCNDVLKHDPEYGPVDIIASLNYSICYFHTRNSLLLYLSNIIRNNYLNPGGIFVCDLFGGAEYHDLEQPLIQTIRSISNFKYIFEQKNLDILTNRINCSMHFKFRDGSTIKNAFQYDFRMWTFFELKEIFTDAGFTRVYIWLMGRNRLHTTESNQDDVDADDDQETTFERIQLHPTIMTTRKNIDTDLIRSWNAYIVGTRE